MDILAGLGTTVAVVGLGYATRQGQSLPFYSTVMIVIALAYVLFAVMAEGLRTIFVETAVAAGFVVVAVAAARETNRRGAAGLVAAGFVAHGGYDLVHHALVTNSVVPAWWPLYCGVVDVSLGGWVLVLSENGRLALHHVEASA
jgi:predicted secreted protein